MRERVLPRPRARPSLGALFEPYLVRLRARIRRQELALVALAALIGVLAGLVVTALREAAQLLHVLLFALPPATRLSASVGVATWRVILVPTLGGLLVGGLLWLFGRGRTRPAVDPIEANALYGGRMSLSDSAWIGLQTLASTGSGASVGLEAGYTQVCAALAASLGDRLRLRRNDLRLLVGCGAAGGIAAAFNAPLTGAFYAFELVIGSYTLGALSPVLASALLAVATTRALGNGAVPLQVAATMVPSTIDVVAFLLVGAAGALGGIALMLGVTQAERLVRRTRLPRWLRPAAGGVVIGALGLISPQVLASGHGALHVDMTGVLSAREVALILVTKALASAVSIGTGFRGGLFFSSLLCGALLGELAASAAALLQPAQAFATGAYAIVGMATLATSVVGAPFTMVFLALETTGDFKLAPAVIGAVLVASLTTRRIFGYSFATWRFHLRGEAIRSPHDIGWMRNLSAGRMMRRDVRTVPLATSLAVFRRQYPLGSTQRVIVVDERDRYAGMILTAEAHAPDLGLEEGSDLRPLLRYQGAVLTPPMTVRDVVDAFAEAEADELAVVADPTTRKVLGLLTEAHVLRRYAEELDRRRRELVGGE